MKNCLTLRPADSVEALGRIKASLAALAAGAALTRTCALHTEGNCRSVQESRRKEDDMFERSLTPSITVTIRHHTRIYFAFVTTAPIALGAPATVPGEILSLQWMDVNLLQRDIIIRAEKAKTRHDRLVPVSQRLHAILDMRRLDPSGQERPPTAYVFGDDLGQRVPSVRRDWEAARKTAKLQHWHLADLRHEAASRYEQAGVPVSTVSKLLGHTSLTTTTTYLNTLRRELHRAVQTREAAGKVAKDWQSDGTEAPAEQPPETPPKSLH
jgi:integrase